jgi:NAD(P)-dependent dehydrogenase (short-subunit alcohol dehydrogenase family)
LRAFHGRQRRGRVIAAGLALSALKGRPGAGRVDIFGALRDIRRECSTSTMGMVHVAHAIAPGMVARNYGTMVFVAFVAGQIGSQTDPPYSASKAANINFAQCLAKDLAPLTQGSYRSSSTAGNENRAPAERNA